ncbi:MAG: serpin family protein [Anaerolineae bacterium]|nr:serpin family protein [Anaerolineae bacterium]
MRAMLVLLVLALLVTGCQGATPAPVEAGTVKSNLPREMAPEIPATDQAALVTGNTAFAVDLYQQLLATEGGNLFFSPHSISVALAMTYAGAGGETAAQMAETLHFTLADADLHRAFNALDQLLAAKPAGEEEAFELHTANSLWAEQSYVFLPEFLDLLAQNYGAGLRLVDFKTAAEAARQAINAWVEEQTAGRIKDLIPADGVDSLTRLVLANAIYFKAGWQYPFAADRTADGDFTTLSGAKVSVPMMEWSTGNAVPYARGEGYQAIELPYKGGEASMVLLVPDAGRFEEFEAGLTGERLQQLLSGLDYNGIRLTMPKFEIEAKFSLADTLRDMGMGLAFDQVQADFSGMDGSRDLYIGDVFHKAFVAVDESGTEAAAATAVVMQLKSAALEETPVTVDCPFIYLIRDTQSGAVLFLGRVVNPG